MIDAPTNIVMKSLSQDDLFLLRSIGMIEIREYESESSKEKKYESISICDRRGYEFDWESRYRRSFYELSIIGILKSLEHAWIIAYDDLGSGEIFVPSLSIGTISKWDLPATRSTKPDNRE